MDTNDTYSSYHSMTGQITEALNEMSKICTELHLDESGAALMASRKKLQSHTFAVGILGEFKRGKSTVINALLGTEVMPADILPCSATMNRVSYDLQPHVQLHMIDGGTQEISVDQLAQYVTKLDDSCSARAENIEEAVVFYPCRFCQNGVDIVDTPGLNDDERMNRITEEIVPKLDAVIMVLVPDNPFSMSEAEFVRNKLMCSDIGRLIFLVNKIDTVRKKDRQRVVDSIREKVIKSVLDKTAQVYGEDSEQFKAVKSKLADIRIFPISAQNALDGRLDGDEAMVKESGMTTFEDALSHMLTEERGVLELSAPLGQLYRCGDDAKKSALVLIQALDTDEETFMKTQRETLEHSQKVRESMKAEQRRLQQSAKKLNLTMASRAADTYAELEEAALQIVDNIHLADPKAPMSEQVKQSLIDSAMEQIEAMSKEKLSFFCERICADVNEVIGKEAVQVSNFVTQAQIEMKKPQQLMSADQNTTMIVDTAGLALDVVTDFMGIYGLGGLISGYRAAGVKGALVGGTAGLAANLLAANLLVGVLAAPALPVVVISCAVGTVVSKLVCNTLFGKSKNIKELAALKESISAQVKENYTKMRGEKSLEKWIEATISEQFDSLCTAMEQECEQAIQEANRTVSQVKIDLARSKAEKEAARTNYYKLISAVDQIFAAIDPLRLKLEACMTRC